MWGAKNFAGGWNKQRSKEKRVRANSCGLRIHSDDDAVGLAHHNHNFVGTNVVQFLLCFLGDDILVILQRVNIVA